jgi:hypothetical protein
MSGGADDFDALQAAVLGTPVIVSSALPFAPSPGEDARRLVRHAFATARAERGQACYFPDTLGDVGPRPGAPTEAMWLGDRVAVSADLAARLKAEAERRATVESRNRLWKAVEDRRWERIETAARSVLNAALGPPYPIVRVRSYRIEHRLAETTFRAHVGPELAEQAGATFVMRDEDIRRALDIGDVELVRQIAEGLLQPLRPLVAKIRAEIKVDDEDAARKGIR